MALTAGIIIMVRPHISYTFSSFIFSNSSWYILAFHSRKRVHISHILAGKHNLCRSHYAVCDLGTLQSHLFWGRKKKHTKMCPEGKFPKQNPAEATRSSVCRHPPLCHSIVKLTVILVIVRKRSWNWGVNQHSLGNRARTAKRRLVNCGSPWRWTS